MKPWRPSSLSLLTAVVLASVVGACRPELADGGAGGLRVAVAASMRPAFEEIVAAYRGEHPGVEIEASYAASGTLYAQLAQGAPFDLFLAADRSYVERLASEGKADGCVTYAVGRLVLWAPKSAGLDVAGRGMGALTDPAVDKVAIAHPDVAPYGRAAVEAMAYYGIEIERAGGMVWGENVAQAAQFVQSGGAQIGLIARSLTTIPELGEAGDIWPVPPEAHGALEHGAAILVWCRDRAAAESFLDYLLGAAAGEILERHGFSPPT